LRNPRAGKREGRRGQPSEEKSELLRLRRKIRSLPKEGAALGKEASGMGHGNREIVQSEGC